MSETTNYQYLLLANEVEDELEQTGSARPAELFHYANTEAMRSIVESGTLWATDSRFFNDPSEHTYGAALLKSALEPLKKKVTDRLERTFLEAILLHHDFDRLGLVVFASCFCEDGDLLSQWRGYAGGGGYSLGVSSDFEVALEDVQEAAIFPGGLTLLKVDYDREAAANTIRGIAEKFLTLLRERLPESGDAMQEVSWAASAASGVIALKVLGSKDPSFREEREWRLVALAEASRVLPALRMRVASNQLVPYLALRLTSALDQESPLPLRRVIIGPTVRAPTAEVSLRLHLDRNGHQGAEIIRSTIPLIF